MPVELQERPESFPDNTNHETEENLFACIRCGCLHDWRKSTSTLRMSYCNSLCERGDLGFTIEGLLAMKRPEKPSEN